MTWIVRIKARLKLYLVVKKLACTTATLLTFMQLHKHLVSRKPLHQFRIKKPVMGESRDKEKKRHNVSFSSDTKDESNDLRYSLESTTFDSSFDQSVLQYSAGTGSWDGNLFSSDDPFLTDAEALSRLSPQRKPTAQRIISIKVEERLSIFFDQFSTNPACRVIGSVYVLPNDDMPDSFCLTIRDQRSHVERYEPADTSSNITANLPHLALDAEDTIFRISLHNLEELQAPVLGYSCTPQLTPMPMLLKTKIVRKGTQCQIAVRIRANPKNRRPLENMVIIMIVPPDVNGNSATMSRKGGLWDDLKRMLSWTHHKLHAGEVLDIKVQFQCADLGSEATSTFPVLTRCDGKSLFSSVTLTTEHTDNSSSPVKLHVAERSRILYRKV
eukprot:scaffold26_cov117-Cylindrotheca_fusiformis.AAC.4